MKEPLTVSFLWILLEIVQMSENQCTTYLHNAYLVEKIETSWWDDEVFNETIIIDANTKFDPSKPTKFITHGLGGNINSVAAPLARAYAKAGFDYNIIGISWKCNSYKKDWVKCFDEAGYYSGVLLKHLVNEYGLDLQDLHIIGFSYGTHVIGKELS